MKILFFLTASLTLLASLPPFSMAYEPCDIKLTNVSPISGHPGEELILHGSWGHTQGTKVPCINKGNMNRLEVLSWMPSRVRVKIPEKLEPGVYKVGVYCNELSEGGSFSSTWLDFKILPIGEASSPEEPINQEIEKKANVYLGQPYSVTTNDGDNLTVEIMLPKLTDERYEIDARKREPRLPKGRVGEEAYDLLRMGVTYIDISFNSPRIAAEYPLENLTWNKQREEETVQHLIAIKKAIEPIKR